DALTVVKSLKSASSPTASVDSQHEEDIQRLIHDCHLNMSDDFNTAKTLATLFEMAARINDFKSGNKKLDSIKTETLEALKNTYIGFMEEVLGLQEETVQHNEVLDGVMDVLISMRKKAREDKNFALSDKIRDELKEVGVQ